MEQKYCKHCGSLLEGETTICLKCGFDGSKGDKFCGNCGKSIEAGQVICIGCGYMLAPNKSFEEEKEEIVSDDKQEYKNYTPTVAKIKKYNNIAYCLMALLFLCLIFLPIYQCKYEPGLDEIESYEQLKDALNNDGYLTKNFSLFDDVVMIVQAFSNDTDHAEGGLILFLGLFAIGCLIDYGIGILIYLKRLATSIGQTTDTATMLMYDDIFHKTENESKKPKYSVPLVIFWSILLTLVDIILSKVLSNEIGSYKILSEDGMTFLHRECVRNMCNVTGVSLYIAVLILIIVAYYVVDYLANKEYNLMVVDIKKKSYT